MESKPLFIFKPPSSAAFKWERDIFLSIKLPKLVYKTKETTILYLHLQAFSTKVERPHFHSILNCSEESLFSWAQK